jgi:hypothetical protein
MENPDDGTERHHMENPDDGTERHHMENPDDAPQKQMMLLKGETTENKKTEAKE